MMLTITYLMALGGCILGWQRWYAAVRRTLAERHLVYLLIAGYWILAATMLASVPVSLIVVDYDPAVLAHRTILVCLVVTLVLQAAIFGFVLTPVMKRDKFRDWPFSKVLIVTECAIVIPIALLVGFHLAIFFNLGNITQALFMKGP